MCVIHQPLIHVPSLTIQHELMLCMVCYVILRSKWDAVADMIRQRFTCLDAAFSVTFVLNCIVARLVEFGKLISPQPVISKGKLCRTALNIPHSSAKWRRVASAAIAQRENGRLSMAANWFVCNLLILYIPILYALQAVYLESDNFWLLLLSLTDSAVYQIESESS